MAWWLALPALAWVVGTPPGAPSRPFLPPSAAHWLGTDVYGRDLLHATIAAAPASMLTGAIATLVAAATGGLLGAAAGIWGNGRLRLPLAWCLPGLPALAFALFELAYVRPLLPGAQQYLAALAALGALAAAMGMGRALRGLLPGSVPLPIDALHTLGQLLLAALPPFLLLLALGKLLPAHTAAGTGLLFGLLMWGIPARLVRAEARRILHLPYAEAARGAGLRPPQLLRQLLPNVWAPLLAWFPAALAATVSLDATLEFIGIGVPAPVPTWGKLLSDGRAFSFGDRGAWWLPLVPGLALFMTILAAYDLRTLSRGSRH